MKDCERGVYEIHKKGECNERDNPPDEAGRHRKSGRTDIMWWRMIDVRAMGVMLGRCAVLHDLIFVLITIAGRGGGSSQSR